MKLSNAFRFKDHIPHDLDPWPKSTQVVVALVVALSVIVRQIHTWKLS